MRRSPAALALATLVAVTACNGDDAAPTDLAPTTTDVAESTSAPSTSTTPTTTPTTPVTTAAPVEATASPTTASTTSETDPRFAILDAVEAASAALRAIVRDPFDDVKLAALDEFFTGRQLEGWNNVIASYRRDNLRQIENSEEPDEILVDLASIAVSEDGASAVLQACSITSGIVVETGGNPDGSDRVIEDRIGRNVVELELIQQGGTWKLSSARSPDENEQIASCE